MVRAEAHRKGGVHGPDAGVLAGAHNLPGLPQPGGSNAQPMRPQPGGVVPGGAAPPVRMEGDERPPVRFGTDVEAPPPPPPAPIRDGR